MTAVASAEPVGSDHAEDERIAAHFDWVLALLSAQDRRAWGPARRRARARSLRELGRYAKRRRFPRNPLHGLWAPTFVDGRGVPCAVAHLMLEEGLGDSVDRIAATTNFAAVGELADALTPLVDRLGLTVDEMALVQPFYCPPDCPPPPPPPGPCSDKRDGDRCEQDLCFESVCESSECRPVTPIECDDGDPATHDACISSRGCISVPIQLPPGAPVADDGGAGDGGSLTEGVGGSQPRLEPAGGCSLPSRMDADGTSAAVLAGLFLLAVRRGRPWRRRR